MTLETELGLGGKTWALFERDDSLDEADRKFRKVYGYPPRAFMRDGGGLKVGPIEED